MRIVLPIDGSQGAHRALRHVMSRAKGGVPLAVELVRFKWAMLPDALWPAFPAVPPGGTAESSLARDARALLAMRSIPYRTHCTIGDPARTIARVADAYDCSEIVMGRMGLSGLMRRALRSLPERVARLAHRSVTIID
jgi:nucleotide-binding universal stress UspA family protein